MAELTRFPNLAGVADADRTKVYEMTQCGIGIVFHTVPFPSEVPGAITGEVHTNGGTLLFTRAWYYWVVSGDVPLKIARRIYEDGKDLAIRAAGHCGNPPPDDWADPSPESLEFIFKDHPSIYDDKAKEEGRFRYVKSYHIDTLEGLKLFVEMMSPENPKVEATR